MITGHEFDSIIKYYAYRYQRQYGHWGLELDDLIQEGRLVLWENKAKLDGVSGKHQRNLANRLVGCRFADMVRKLKGRDHNRKFIDYLEDIEEDYRPNSEDQTQKRLRYVDMEKALDRFVSHPKVSRLDQEVICSLVREETSAEYAKRCNIKLPTAQMRRFVALKKVRDIYYEGRINP